MDPKKHKNKTGKKNQLLSKGRERYMFPLYMQRAHTRETII